jgi:hypothetical protein
MRPRPVKVYDISPRVFEKRFADLIRGLSFLSGVPMPRYGGRFGHWGNRSPDPWASLRRSARIFCNQDEVHAHGPPKNQSN